MAASFTTRNRPGSSPVPWELQARFYRRANRSEMRRRVYWERQVPMVNALDAPTEPGDLLS
jgi:hypothetical protein